MANVTGMRSKPWGMSIAAAGLHEAPPSCCSWYQKGALVWMLDQYRSMEPAGIDRQPGFSKLQPAAVHL